MRIRIDDTHREKPVAVLTIDCDLELLSQMIADGEVTPERIKAALQKALVQITAAIGTGMERKQNDR